MNFFSDPDISIATPSDIPDLLALLNSAYRGEVSKQGWTTEANLIAGAVRTDAQTLAGLMASEGVVFLKYINADKKITGCVNLQQQSGKIYLGMFSVSPTQQGGGIGKRILLAAEEYARNNNSPAIFMHVITDRKELIEWYKRRGYVDTGKRIDFKEDGLTGKHLKPLQFMVLEKAV
jgi:ribosomal protein S18 acetylase RimI-like enzyme